MGEVKRWLEDHIDEFTDEELLDMDYDQEDIDFMRECYSQHHKNELKKTERTSKT